MTGNNNSHNLTYVKSPTYKNKLNYNLNGIISEISNTYENKIQRKTM